MKFILIKSSDVYERNPIEVEINSIEDLKELQKQMQNIHLNNCNKTEFGDCKLILDFKLRPPYYEDNQPTILVYDYFIEY